MSYIESLKDVIRKLHGVESSHVKSVPVTEIFNGQTVWNGIVEIFKLHGHPEADTAYAWSYCVFRSMWAGDSIGCGPLIPV